MVGLWIWGSGQNLGLEIPLQNCPHESGTAPPGREKSTRVGSGLTGGGEEPAEETRLGSQRTQKIRKWGGPGGDVTSGRRPEEDGPVLQRPDLW